MSDFKHPTNTSQRKDKALKYRMDQQGKAHILDSSDPAAWSGSLKKVDGHHLRGQGQNRGSLTGNGKALEESQIRRELETEIERDLEEEIKDGIYHLALRLHRLYQHKIERSGREESENRAKLAKEKKKKTTVSEININIKLDGGTKVEIKESKKEAPLPPENSPLPRSSRPENVQQQVIFSNKKFDWVNTLRSSSNTSTSTSASENAKRNGNHASKQHSRGNSCVDKDLLELGWKY